MDLKLKGFWRGSLVGTFRAVNRFGRTNYQAGAEFYRGLGKGFWGYLQADTSPDRDFLPLYSFGGGLFRSYPRFELGTGVRYMRFKNSDVFLVIPSVILFYKSFYDSVSLYFNPARSTYTLLNRLGYRDGRKHLFLSVSAGTSSERLQAGEDFVRYSTFSFSAGGELRVKRNLNVGGSMRYEDREGLYRRYGIEIYGRLFW